MNKKIIIGIIVFVVVIGVAITLAFTMGNSKDNVEGQNGGNVGEKINEDVTFVEDDEEYDANWEDTTVYIHGVEFKLPMTFAEFENKISGTKYKLYKDSDREKTIYPSIMSQNQITYNYQVREYSSSQMGLAYQIYVHLQNIEETSQPAYNTMVIGIETETLSPYDDMDERGFDNDLYFTKEKLHIGQSMTKSKLEKIFGRGNSWINKANSYGAGKYTSGFYKFAKFQCSMNNENRISKLIMKSYIEKGN